MSKNIVVLTRILTSKHICDTWTRCFEAMIFLHYMLVLCTRNRLTTTGTTHEPCLVRLKLTVGSFDTFVIQFLRVVMLFSSSGIIKFRKKQYKIFFLFSTVYIVVKMCLNGIHMANYSHFWWRHRNVTIYGSIEKLYFIYICMIVWSSIQVHKFNCSCISHLRTNSPRSRAPEHLCV